MQIKVQSGDISTFAAQFFDEPGLGGQNIGNVIRQDPGGHV